MGIDLTHVIEVLVGVLAVIAVRYLVPYARTLISEEHYAYLCMISRVAVYAAEQLGILKLAENKLEYAQKYVKKMLAIQHFRFDDETVRAAIEAALLEMKRAA
jgi:LL-H family phage holin